MKCNSILDGDIVRKLYAASQAGVKIKLLVRGICAVVAGVEGVSENISVRSIVGTFLEHSRIYVFGNGGDPLIYMGSADLMPRNLIRRVEVLFPVEDAGIRARVTAALDLMWKDNTNAWEMNSIGEYSRVKKPGRRVNSQKSLSLN
jgi:polyphosphate kinase